MFLQDRIEATRSSVLFQKKKKKKKLERNGSKGQFRLSKLSLVEPVRRKQVFRQIEGTCDR